MHKNKKEIPENEKDGIEIEGIAISDKSFKIVKCPANHNVYVADCYPETYTKLVCQECKIKGVRYKYPIKKDIRQETIL
jgi:hypothetical protein